MQKPCIMTFKGVAPKLGKDVFVAPTASIIGDVEIGDETNIWFGVTIRGDVNTVRIGSRTNIQDGTVCHVTRGTGPLKIGNDVTIGHSAIIHACTIEDGAFVGMGAIIMDGAVVQTGGMVAAGALLSPNKVVKKGEVYAGVPAKLFRPMTEDEVKYIPWSATHYVALAKNYLNAGE